MRRPGVIVCCAFVSLAAAVTVAGQKAIPELAAARRTAVECARSVVLTFEDTREERETRETPIWQLPGTPAFFYEAGMTIDADGAPNAYNPQNTGLDDIANAGQPGHWDGIIADGDGKPILQGPDDPYPGYYVSCTSLSDRSKRGADPTRYVDATKIPYIVLPGDVARETGTRLGDFAVVINQRNGKSSYAIFADVGTLGEGFVALAQNLGINSDARQGGARRGLLYVVFPGSGNGKPRTTEEIGSETENLYQAWGGATQVTACSLH